MTAWITLKANDKGSPEEFTWTGCKREYGLRSIQPMFTAVRETQEDGTVLVRISGTLDESVDLRVQLGPPSRAQMIVSCRDLERINSAGVRAWIRYFNEVTHGGGKPVFLDVGPTVIALANLFPNFLSGGRIESLYLPYVCAHCKSQYFQRATAEWVRANLDSLPHPACPKCGQPTIFDDIEDEYFSCLKRII